MNEVRKGPEYWQRLGNVRCAPKSSSETRVLLIANERGLTEKQLQKFYFTRRKGSKPHFDYQLFANKQKISLDWLFDGDLTAHPRGPAPRAQRASPSRAQSAQLQEFKEALESLDEKHLQTSLGYVRILADGGAA
jgi:hypothetical protein